MIPDIFAPNEPTLLELVKNTLERLEKARTKFRECWTFLGLISFLIGVLCSFFQSTPSYSQSTIVGYSCLLYIVFHFFIFSYVNWCMHISEVGKCLKIIQSLSRNPRKQAGIEEVRKIIKDQRSQENVNDIFYILVHLYCFIALTLTSVAIIPLRIRSDLPYGDVPYLIVYGSFFIGFSLAALIMAIKNWRTLEETKKYGEPNGKMKETSVCMEL